LKPPRHQLLVLIVLFVALLGASGVFAQTQAGSQAEGESTTAGSTAESTAESNGELDDDLAFCDAPLVVAELAEAAAAAGTDTSDLVRFAELASTLRRQLDEIEPAHAAFIEAWEEFNGLAKRTGMARADRVLRTFLPSYGRSERALRTMLGCREATAAGAADRIDAEAADPEAPDYGSSLCPCPAIPIAHQLAELAVQLHTYVEGRFGEALPEAVPAVQRLDQSAATLHDLLHAIEITIPQLQRTFGELAGVSTPIESIRAPFDALQPLVGRCQLNPEASMTGMDAGGAEASDHQSHSDHSGHSGHSDHSDHPENDGHR